MPTICEFFGIVIRMYYQDHAPAHFHAYYGEHNAVVEIETLQVREGRLPRRALSLVVEWAIEHREELLEDWRLAQAHQPLRRVAPLE